MRTAGEEHRRISQPWSLFSAGPSLWMSIASFALLLVLLSVLFAEHFEKVKGDWKTCQINVLLDHKAEIA